MALFGRDYDRDFGYRGGTWNQGYDRNYRGGWDTRTATGWNAGDRDYGYFGENRYDTNYGGYGAAGYDRGYKSRWETDFGDPFGDRTSHTPMRMIRGRFRGGNQPDYGWESGYDRDYAANPMGYDPYYDPNVPQNRWNQPNRGGTWMRGYDRNFRTSGRRYDTGWF